MSLFIPFSVTRFAVIKIVPAIISVSEKYFSDARPSCSFSQKQQKRCPKSTSLISYLLSFIILLHKSK